MEENSNAEEELNGKNIQHLLIQYFLKNQSVPETRFIRWIDGLKKKSNDPNIFDKDILITQANKIFRSYGFIIKLIENYITNEIFYILINEIEDSLTKKHIWPQQDHMFYYLLVNSIIEPFINTDSDDQDSEQNSNGEFIQPSIGKTKAVNLTRKTNLSLVLGEKMIQKWINGHWFHEKDGRIFLGVRTLAQNNVYLIEKYGLASCYQCNLICLYGHKCPKCNTFIHDYCCKSTQYCSTCSSKFLMNQKIFNN